MLLVVLGSLLLSAPEPQNVSVASVPEPAEQKTNASRSIRGGWLSLTPLGVAVPGPGGADVSQHRHAVRAGFRWGFATGASFEPTPHLFLNVAASFDQVVWIFRNARPGGYELCFAGDCYGWDERGVGQLMRVGPELRIGWTSRRVLAWAMVAGQLAISRIRLDCNNSVEPQCDRHATDVGPGVGAGLGLAIRATPRIAVGLETSVEHSWLDRRDDPFRAVRSLDLGLIIALRF